MKNMTSFVKLNEIIFFIQYYLYGGGHIKNINKYFKEFDNALDEVIIEYIGKL